MSSKLLYSLSSSDENPKQMGCINGLLHHFLTGRAADPSRNNQKKLPPCQSQQTKEKSVVVQEHKEPHHQLTIKSARNLQNPTSYIDSPRPLRPSNLQNQSNSRKETSHMRRFSYDGKESRKEANLKLNDLPRLSLDSRQGKLLQQDEPVSHRQVSTILTKLMGLEDISQSTPARSARSEDESDTSVSIYKEIDKRVNDLDFTKAGKDLRALKHILDAMQRSASSSSSDSTKTVEDPSPRKSNSPGKAVRNGSRAGSYQMPSNLPRVRTGQSAKPDAKVSSPRTQQKNQKIEKFSQERRSRSNQEQRSSVKQKAQRSSKKMEVRSKRGVQRKLELDEHLDIVHTPRPSPKLCKPVGHGLNVIEEPAAALKEQPSPVSVLDADFYGDESPSPVKKKATVFRDDYSAAEDGNQLSSIRRTCFAADNMEKTNNKESPDSMWMKRALCTERSQLRPKAPYPSMEHENEHTARIIAMDLGKRSESWTDFTRENSWLVLDIERLIFNDLIVEVVHEEASR